MPDELQRAVAAGLLHAERAPGGRARPGSAPASEHAIRERRRLAGCCSDGRAAPGSAARRLSGSRGWIDPAEDQQIEPRSDRPRAPASPRQARRPARAHTPGHEAGQDPEPERAPLMRGLTKWSTRQAREHVGAGQRVRVAGQRQVELLDRPCGPPAARRAGPACNPPRPRTTMRRRRPGRQDAAADASRRSNDVPTLQPGQTVGGQHARRQHDHDREATRRAQSREPGQQPQQVVQVDRAVLAQRQDQPESARPRPSRALRGGARRPARDRQHQRRQTHVEIRLPVRPEPPLLVAGGRGRRTGRSAAPGRTASASRRPTRCTGSRCRAREKPASSINGTSCTAASSRAGQRRRGRSTIATVAEPRQPAAPGRPTDRAHRPAQRAVEPPGSAGRSPASASAGRPRPARRRARPAG